MRFESHAYSCWLVVFVLGLVVGRRVSRTLANRFKGSLILAKRELTLPVRGDLASFSDSDCCSLGVAVVVIMALLVSFVLEIKARVVVPMVVILPGVA